MGFRLSATDRVEHLESIERWTNTLLVLVFLKGFDNKIQNYRISQALSFTR